MNQETRQFQMHPRLLYDVVMKQAGTLAKGILEAVMNAADARAKKCILRVEKNHVTIEDDGHGFRSRDEIEKFFEVFGQPHDESEGKIYGTFRMGRGQLMSFGENTWQTGAFTMNVDIKRRGLDYDLIEGGNQDGCKIHVNLYEVMAPGVVQDTLRDLKKWCKYAPIQVQLNGEDISEDVTKAKWDHETDDAYIRLTHSGSISVYNLGIHVMELPSYRFGCGGEIVSKKQLEVNFARNDIQSTCPTWRKIRPFIDQKSTEKNTTKTSLDDAGRKHLADKLRRGELHWGNIRKARIFTGVNGRQYTIAAFSKYPAFTLAPKNHRLAARLMDQGVAFVLSDECLERFECSTGKALEELLQANLRRHTGMEFVELEDILGTVSEEHVILQDKELTPTERAWLAAINKTTAFNEGSYTQLNTRRIVFGESDTAQGWTDGKTYVAIERNWFHQQSQDLHGITAIGALLCHEFAHDEPAHDRCDHGLEFYETYERLTQEALPNFTYQCLGEVTKSLRKAELVVKRNLLDNEFKVHDAEQTTAAIAARTR